jgi:hypothetical protein
MQTTTLPSPRPKLAATVAFRLTEAERDQLERLAARCDVQLSELLRHFVLRGLQHHAGA